MCGIAGELRTGEPGRKAVVDAMLETIRYRGPDAQGVYASGDAAIGQNRLSIIDLETGDPPITNEDGSIGVVNNGEIYNFVELRKQLEREGKKFSTACDTEVIAHLAEDRDPVEIARALDGMFAFAIWDTRRQRLILGRDRFGKKPLYLWEGPEGRLAFGSEIPAVLAHPDVSDEVDDSDETLGAYLTFGYVPTPRTFYKQVTSLEPGHVLVAEKGRPIRKIEYWRPPLPERDGTPRLDCDMQEAAEEVRRLLSLAVKKRMIADVPLGAFLSGGIDSSAIVALMAEHSSRPIKTFTIGFEEESYDERPYASMVAKRYGTDHTTFVVKSDSMDLLPILVQHHGQPFGDSSALAVWHLAELTRQHVTVALAGDGGDELFAGYERMGAAALLDRAQRVGGPLVTGAAKALARLQFGRLGTRGAKIDRFLNRASLPAPEALMEWVSYVPHELRAEMAPSEGGWGRRDYLGTWQDSDGAPSLARVLDMNIRTYLLDDLLPKVDRMSMAHALEVRSPFLDTELAEFTLCLPTNLHTRGMSLKRILKSAVSDLVPSEIVGRPKRGFGVPVSTWDRKTPWAVTTLSEWKGQAPGRACAKS